MGLNLGAAFRAIGQAVGIIRRMGADAYVSADCDTLKIRMTAGLRYTFQWKLSTVNVWLSNITWESASGVDVKAQLNYLPTVDALSVLLVEVGTLREVHRFIATLKSINEALDKRGF